MKILIIDDDCGALVALNRLFGGRCLLASTLEEGIFLARSEQPDLTVMDVIFPGMPENGIDSAPAVRAVAPHTRVVVMTALPRQGDATRAYHAGCCAYVGKTDLDQLRRVVEEVKACVQPDRNGGPDLPKRRGPTGDLPSPEPPPSVDAVVLPMRKRLLH